MKKRIRILRLIVLLSACMSAMLFVGVAVLLVRSTWVTDEVTHVAVVRPGEPARWQAYKARSHRGVLFFSVLEFDDDAGIYDSSYLGWRVVSDPTTKISLPARRSAIERLGFIFGLEGGPAVNRWWQRYLFVPHWFVLIVLGSLSAPLINQIRRVTRARRRAAAGLCPVCGYDQRATPGQCPECGMVAHPA